MTPQLAQLALRAGSCLRVSSRPLEAMGEGSQPLQLHATRTQLATQTLVVHPQSLVVVTVNFMILGYPWQDDGSTPTMGESKASCWKLQ